MTRLYNDFSMTYFVKCGGAVYTINHRHEYNEVWIWTAQPIGYFLRLPVAFEDDRDEATLMRKLRNTIELMQLHMVDAPVKITDKSICGLCQSHAVIPALNFPLCKIERNNINKGNITCECAKFSLIKPVQGRGFVPEYFGMRGDAVE